MLTLAAALIVLLALVHSILGERYIVVRLLRRENLPKIFGGVEFTKRTLRFAWHLTSVAWCGIAGLLLVLAQPNPCAPCLVKVIAVTAGLSGLVTFVGSRGRHLAWVVFLAIAALSWWGAQ